MKETDIDCMKYRKSTHLAGVDVETIIEEKGNFFVTIKEAYYDKGVNVSGNKTDGYFLEFLESGMKPLVANSGNRKTIAKMVKTMKNISSAESRKLNNWIGLKIELTFDPTVKMMGEVTGGIKVAPTSPIPTISDANALGLLNACKTITELTETWLNKISATEKNIPTVLALKEQLKTTLK